MLLLLLLCCHPPSVTPLPADSGPPVETPDSGTRPWDTAVTHVPGDGDTAPPESVPSTAPLVEPGRGLYDASFRLTLSSPLDGASIVYTLDGRDPRGATGRVYAEPLPIDTTTLVRAIVSVDGAFLGSPVTHTYLFPARVADQTAPEGWPDTWWTWYTPGGFAADYGMDPEIVSDPAYASAFPDVFRGLPVLSVTLDPDDLWGASGIYENPTSEGDAWERGASLEWLWGEETFQADAGIRIHGGASRDPACSAKKSFRVSFRDTWGPKELDQPLFPDAGVPAFDDLILRAGYNLTWTHWSATQRGQAQYRRESLARGLHLAMGWLAPHERTALLFLDGVFWGIYAVHERVDADFMVRYQGGEDEDWDVIHTGEAIDGTLDAWQEVMRTADRGLATDDALARIQALVELNSFIDYYLLNLYLGNDDWPYNNWVAARLRQDGALFQFFLWDTEHILEDVTTNMISTDAAGTPGRLFQRLRENLEFRVHFGDHAQKWLMGDGVLTPASVLSRWNELGLAVTPAVVAESARWGDYRRDVYSYAEGPYELYTVNDHYLPEDARLTTSWIPQRTDLFLDQLRAADLYPRVAAPTLDPPCGEGGPTTLHSESGPVVYTLDGTDPRLAGGALSPSALTWEAPVVLEGALQARTWTGTDWSALVTCPG